MIVRNCKFVLFRIQIRIRKINVSDDIVRVQFDGLFVMRYRFGVRLLVVVWVPEPEVRGTKAGSMADGFGDCPDPAGERFRMETRSARRLSRP